MREGGFGWSAGSLLLLHHLDVGDRDHEDHNAEHQRLDGREQSAVVRDDTGDFGVDRSSSREGREDEGERERTDAEKGIGEAATEQGAEQDERFHMVTVP